MLAAPRPPREGRARGGGGGGSSFVAQRLAQAGLDSDFLSEAPEPSSRHRRGGYAEADDIEAPSSDVYGRHASRRDSRYGRQNWDDYDDGEVRNCTRQPPPALGSMSMLLSCFIIDRCGGAGGRAVAGVARADRGGVLAALRLRLPQLLRADLRPPGHARAVKRIGSRELISAIAGRRRKLPSADRPAKAHRSTTVEHRERCIWL